MTLPHGNTTHSGGSARSGAYASGEQRPCFANMWSSRTDVCFGLPLTRALPSFMRALPPSMIRHMIGEIPPFPPFMLGARGCGMTWSKSKFIVSGTKRFEQPRDGPCVHGWKPWPSRPPVRGCDPCYCVESRVLAAATVSNRTSATVPRARVGVFIRKTVGACVQDRL